MSGWVVTDGPRDGWQHARLGRGFRHANRDSEWGAGLAGGDLFDDDCRDGPGTTRLRDGRIADSTVSRDTGEEDRVNVRPLDELKAVTDRDDCFDANGTGLTDACGVEFTVLKWTGRTACVRTTAERMPDSLRGEAVPPGNRGLHPPGRDPGWTDASESDAPARLSPRFPSAGAGPTSELGWAGPGPGHAGVCPQPPIRQDLPPAAVGGKAMETICSWTVPDAAMHEAPGRHRDSPEPSPGANGGVRTGSGPALGVLLHSGQAVHQAAQRPDPCLVEGHPFTCMFLADAYTGFFEGGGFPHDKARRAITPGFTIAHAVTAGDVFAEPSHARRDLSNALLAGEGACTITAGAVNGAGDLAGPAAALKVRPADTARGAVTGFRDCQPAPPVDLTNLVVHRVHRPQAGLGTVRLSIPQNCLGADPRLGAGNGRSGQDTGLNLTSHIIPVSNHGHGLEG